MRSLFLEGLADEQFATSALSEAFPDRAGSSTKTLFNSAGSDAIAWLYVTQPDDPDEQDGPFIIQADLSGRYAQADADPLVVQALRRVQTMAGGIIRDDDGNTV